MIAAAVTIALVFAGYLATYLNGPRPAQRQERLARVVSLVPFPSEVPAACARRGFGELKRQQARLPGAPASAPDARAWLLSGRAPGN